MIIILVLVWSMFKSENYDERREGEKPYIILLHYTGMQSAQAAIDRLTDPKSKVSAHYLVDENAGIFNMVDEQKRAWHAGLSYWKGENDINSVSIGIEIVNPGHEFGYCKFPEEQICAVCSLCKEICSRNDINYILGHSDVAPQRKKDPGELFDWKYLYEHGVGDWPFNSLEYHEKAKKIMVDNLETRKLFDDLGYNPQDNYADIITAFQRHYYPETFQKDHPGIPGNLCEETLSRLLALSCHR